MKEREQYRRLIRMGFGAILLLIYAVIFWHVWRTYYADNMMERFYRRGHWLMTGLYVFGIYYIINSYGGWKCGYLRIFNLIYIHGIGIVLANAAFYVGLILLIKHYQNVIPLLGMSLVQFVLAIIWAEISTRAYRLAYPPRSVLMVYGDRPATSLINKIRTRMDRFQIDGKISIHEGLARVEEEIPKYRGVVLCDMPSKERNLLAKYCYARGIRAYIVPKISDLIMRSAETQHMFDTPMLMSRNAGLTIEVQIIKRLMDIVVSAIGLIVSSPIMAVVALCIKKEDGGSVIYRQKRLTKDGKVFDIYKFRSMRENAESDGVARLAGEHDDRITKVGHVIRACRLDELPQLWNIFRGDMSLVGPRPERPEIAAEYEQEIPEFAYRLKVKAGLTGYAQVYGKYNTTAYDKLKLDLMYIQECSLILDIEIMLRTVQILFMKEATEGMEDGQTIAISTAPENEPAEEAKG